MVLQFLTGNTLHTERGGMDTRHCQIKKRFPAIYKGTSKKSNLMLPCYRRNTPRVTITIKWAMHISSGLPTDMAFELSPR